MGAVDGRSPSAAPNPLADARPLDAEKCLGTNIADRYPHQFEGMSAILMRLPLTWLALICT